MTPKSMEELIYAFLYGLGQDIREGKELFQNNIFYLIGLTQSDHDDKFTEDVADIEKEKATRISSVPPSSPDRNLIINEQNFKMFYALIRMLNRAGMDTVRFVDIDA